MIYPKTYDLGNDENCTSNFANIEEEEMPTTVWETSFVSYVHFDRYGITPKTKNRPPDVRD